MVYSFIRSILDVNLMAKYYLNHKAGKGGMFVCRGRIQLSLAPDAIINPPQEVCYIGTPLLGTATPRNNTTVISAASEAIVTLNGAKIGRGVILSTGSSAQLNIGSHSYITDGTRIAAQNSIAIGKNCAISWGVTILDDDGHGFGPPPYSAPIVIEDNVWIGCHVIILKGVTIGEGSVVAAGSVVNKSCPPHSLLAGVPARIVREGVNWTDQWKLKA
jgi:acetyltransferase-like isoleucine patch superfamily enzyme